jgi:hypothetical protein
MIRSLLFTILFLGSIPGFAQQKEEVYEGDIRESDLRRRELVEKVKKGEIPAAIKLRFSRKESDFLVFYDIEGRSIYYRYREDRFDTDAEKRVADLIPGEAYEVTGPFLGMYYASMMHSSDHPKYKEMLNNADAIPAFLFKSARPLRIEQILL